MLVQRVGEQLTGTGTTSRGRFWFSRTCQTTVNPRTCQGLLLGSVNPFATLLSCRRQGSATDTAYLVPLPAGPLPPDPTSLPCVGVVDTGIPADHKQLKSYRRGQFYPLEAPRTAVGDHGSLVASRVVLVTAHRILNWARQWGNVPSSMLSLPSILQSIPGWIELMTNA